MSAGLTSIQEKVGKAPVEFKRILVAVDGSEQSAFAVEAAAGLARQLGAEVILVNVFRVDCGPELCFVEPQIRDRCIEAGRSFLRSAKAEMPEGTHVEKVLCEGDPAEEIISTALRDGVDLIIMGTHGRAAMAQVFVGSVANAVIRKATCPVMTVSHARSFD